MEGPDRQVLAPAGGINAYAVPTGDPFLPYRLKAGTDVFMCYGKPTPAWFDGRGCVLVRINALGLRDREDLALEPAPGTVRVLAVGDSFTFGIGVRVEDAWPWVLEDSLRATHPGRPVEVVNAGFAGGWNLCHHVTWLIREGFAMKPAGVVLAVCLNDLGDVPMTVHEPATIAFPLRGRSRLIDLLVGSLEDRRAARVRDPDYYWEKHRRRHNTGEPWEWWDSALETAQVWCRELQVRLLVVVFPMLVQLDGRYPFIRFHERIAAFCRENGLPFLDLLPEFLGRDALSLWVHPADQHPSPEGHRIAARAIEARLAEERWVR